MLRCLGDPWEGPTLASLRGIQEGFVGGSVVCFFNSQDNPRTSTIYFCYKLRKVKTLQGTNPSSFVGFLDLRMNT